MFEGFEEFDISISPSLTFHGVKSGTGPPLLLLHGFPQTHHIWHLIAPQLVPQFTVICIDIRGYGQSSKPPSSASENHAPYSKSVMASDCAAVMTHLGFGERFSIVAHDRGARIAHKLCVDYPERVEKAMLLDIAPTLAMYERTDREFATAYWHWFFLIQPAPFPENLLMGNVEDFQGRFFGGLQYNQASFIHPANLRLYMAQFGAGNGEGVHAMCEDYRAAATIDLQEARADLAAGRRIRCPIRVLWGRKGVLEERFDCLALWREVSEGEVEGEAVESGHYIAEEVPDVLLRHIREFF